MRLKLSVTTTSGVEPEVYNLDALPESITTAHLPCRLLLPLGGNPTEALEGQFIRYRNGCDGGLAD